MEAAEAAAGRMRRLFPVLLVLFASAAVAQDATGKLTGSVSTSPGAFRPRADMWRDLGANGFARDLRDTVTLVRGLYALPPE